MLLSRIWDWLKARWEWSKGHCPACHRRFYGQHPLYNSGCEVCDGEHDDMTIWSKWRNWKAQPPEPPAKVLHQQKAQAIWHSNAQEAVVEKEE
jgi:hypothetical protein